MYSIGMKHMCKQPLSQPIAQENRTASTCDTQKEIEQGGEPGRTKQQLIGPQSQTTKSRIGPQKTNIQKETPCRANQNCSISKRGDERKQKSASNIDKQDIIGPTFAQLTLHKQAHQITSQCATEAPCED